MFPVYELSAGGSPTCRTKGFEDFEDTIPWRLRGWRLKKSQDRTIEGCRSWEFVLCGKSHWLSRPSASMTAGHAISMKEERTPPGSARSPSPVFDSFMEGRIRSLLQPCSLNHLVPLPEC